MLADFLQLDAEMQALDERVMETIGPRLAEVERVKEYNQLKMLRAFTQSRVAATHMAGGSGYGYGDAGRDKLEEVFARLTGSEAALFRHQFMSGTHALAVALFGLLRPGQRMLCATGLPYDTLHDVIGLSGAKGQGSLMDFGVEYEQLELGPDGLPDLAAIARQAPGCRLLYLQRSRGYAARRSLAPADIGAAARAARQGNPDIVVVVDNCYGEFTRTQEPVEAGADLIVGSLIKNPGGGIAPTGGYVAGKKVLVELCASRFTAPGVGGEIGSSGEVLRQLWLGLYFAPQVTAEALKTGVYAAALFEELGYGVEPLWSEERDDIITAIRTGSAQRLCALCGQIQRHSPVDSFAVPEPWPMPGYGCDVIMAAGAFTQGSSIELSCDGPMRAPYTAYLQGGLNFMASRAAVLAAAVALGRG